MRDRLQEYVSSGLTRHRRCHVAIHQYHRQLRLRPRQGQPQALLARQQRADRQRVQHGSQFARIKRACRRIGGYRNGRFARRQELQRSGDIATQPLEQRVDIVPGDPESPRHGVPSPFIRQQSAEERSHSGRENGSARNGKKADNDEAESPALNHSGAYANPSSPWRF